MKMISMKYLFWFQLILIFFSSCNSSLSPDEATIAGRINGAGGQFVFLEELTVNDLLKIDSTEIRNDGSFNFTSLPDETGIFLLKLQSRDFLTMIMNKGDHIEILSDTSIFPQEYRIKGNRDSEILKNYFTVTAINQEQLDSLSRAFNTSTHLPGFYKIKLGLDSAFAALFSKQQHFARQTIEENPGSLASVLLINQRFGNKKLFDENDDFELMVNIDSCLMKAYPGNSHVVAHHNRVEGILEKRQQQQEAETRLAPGRFAPPLKLPNLNGDIISLESLQGNIVMLYFWSSYSPPCRAANIQLKEVYKNYKSKGLEVYSVSLDHNKKIWKDVVEMEQLDWINVSDLQGLASPVVKLYNLPEELPYYYVIDKDGNILKRGKRLPELQSIF
jgi:peroxiredoxin